MTEVAERDVIHINGGCGKAAVHETARLYAIMRAMEDGTMASLDCWSCGKPLRGFTQSFDGADWQAVS